MYCDGVLIGCIDRVNTFDGEMRVWVGGILLVLRKGVNEVYCKGELISVL